MGLARNMINRWPCRRQPRRRFSKRRSTMACVLSCARCASARWLALGCGIASVDATSCPVRTGVCTGSSLLFKGGKRFGKGEITKEISRRGGALRRLHLDRLHRVLPDAAVGRDRPGAGDRIGPRLRHAHRDRRSRGPTQRRHLRTRGAARTTWVLAVRGVEAAAWREHLYRFGVIGSEQRPAGHDARRPVRPLQALLHDHNASLVMVGDFDSQQLLDENPRRVLPAPTPAADRRAAADLPSAAESRCIGPANRLCLMLGLPRPRSQPPRCFPSGGAQLDPGRRFQPDRPGRRALPGSQSRHGIGVMILTARSPRPCRRATS